MIQFDSERQLSAGSKPFSKYGLISSLEYALVKDSTSNYELFLKTLIRISIISSLVTIFTMFFSVTDLHHLILTAPEFVFVVLLLVFHLISLALDLFTCFALNYQDSERLRKCILLGFTLYVLFLLLIFLMVWNLVKRTVEVQKNYPIKLELGITEYDYLNISILLIAFNAYEIIRLIMVYQVYKNIVGLLKQDEVKAAS